ncbi:unnamed protein product [Oikopleura dioica]|uniref:Uncharacterized protein n=1 Tax=Oikopleura dioica TaxID=34765 RepID=E4YBC1_OIKDI|nr:unnamed protein product [Oikopleura dioica]
MACSWLDRAGRAKNFGPIVTACPNLRSSYDFENRSLIVSQKDEEVIDLGEREENIYVYNNAREVVTHVNYSLEEIEAMIEVGQMDEVDKKQDTKEQRMMFIAFALPLIFFYFTTVEPERCIFRRRRLTSEEKKIIIEGAEKINAQKSSAADFVAPAFIEPSKFIERPLPPLEDLKSILRRKSLEVNSFSI